MFRFPSVSRTAGRPHNDASRRSARSLLVVESLEDRALPANNLTVADVNFNDSTFVRVQSTGPTTTIRTKAPDAQVSLKTIQNALKDPGARTVIVTTDVANGQGANNGHQAGNIVWDATAVGSLNFAGFGTGKTLVFETVDEQGAVGNITLTAVQFLNGGSDDQISLRFDSSAPGGNILFQANGAASPTVGFAAEAVKDLTVNAGSGAFTFTDSGFITPGDAGGAISIAAGPVTLSHSGGLTAGAAVTVTAAGDVLLNSGTGLLAHGNLSITAGAGVIATNGGLASETGKVSVSGTTIGLDNMFITAPGGFALTGTTSVGLTGGTYDISADVTIAGGTVGLTGVDLLSNPGTVDDASVSGTTVGLVNTSVAATGAVLVSGTAVTLDGAILRAGAGLTVSGPVALQGSVDISAGGAIGFTGAVNGASDLTLSAGGVITVGGDVGTGTPLSSLALLQGNLELGTHNLNATTITVGQAFDPIEATLGLTGTLTGFLVVANSGNLAPGGVGTVGLLTVVGDVLFTGGDFAVDFGPGGTADELFVIGNVTISGSSRLGGGLGTGQLTSPTATLIDYSGTLVGTFSNASLGVPVLVGTDAITVLTYAPKLLVSPYTPPGGVGTTAVGMDPLDTTLFKATITGGGQVLTGTDGAGKLFLVARNTTPLSSLTVTTTANASDDLVTFAAGVLVSGPLALFSAPKVNIGTQLRASGRVASAAFRDFLDAPAGTGVRFGGLPAQLTTITARNILGSVHTDSTLTSLKVAQKLGAHVNAPFFEDSLVTAPVIGTVTAGSATTNVTSPGRVAAVKVIGDFAGDVTGASVGTVSARTITGDIHATGGVGVVKATGLFNGLIDAASLGTFSAGGGSATLRTTGAITSLIGTGTDALNVRLSASSVGSVRVARELIGDGDPTTTDWTVTAGIGTLTAGAVIGLDLTARNLGATSVIGNATFGLAGSIEDSIFTLTGNDGTLLRNGLKSLTVKGNVLNSRFDVRAGNVGPVVVGRFHNSQLWVGYAPPPSGTFTAGSFVPGSFRLASFRTTAIPTTVPHPLQWAFQGSEVAADSIGAVTLSGLNTDNGGTPFGIKIRAPGAIVKVVKADPAFPAAKLNTALVPSLNPIAGDFYFLDV
ncbi:MAG TPA: hypothetical protein VKE40_08175 [Gemmataceae bacterium]|nr:hypothetical protein [Gemmataceae bacterium]